MKLIEIILNAMEHEMTTPTNYGWFHIMFILIVIAATVLLCIFFKDTNDKTIRKICLIGWVIIVILEIIKEIEYSSYFENSELLWDYPWYIFPFQLCSTPLYVLPFVIFLKNEQVRKYFISYMMTFSLFGGIAVYFYPNDVFTSTTIINFQTMIHHGMQIVLGVFLVVVNRKRYNFKFFLKGIAVFAGLSIVAMILNITMYHVFQYKGLDDTFNMFFVSPYFDCTLPVLSLIYPKVPYIVFLLIYNIGFAIVSAILYGIQKLILNLSNKEFKKC